MKKLSKIRNSIELDVSLSPLHEQSEFPLSCLICKEDYDQDYFTEISKIFRQKKMKTERIGIGVCFNSDMKINEIEMEEHLIREPEEESNELIFVYSDFDSASIELTEAKPEEITQEISEKVEEAPEKRKRKVKKQAKKQKEEGEEMEELTVQTPSQLDINKISRDKSPRGTQYLNVDVDIEAGEEASSTDGIIELEQIEYAESETSVQLAEEDFMDVDVILEDLKKDDKIEAILPISPNLKDISERISLAKVPEVKDKLAQEEKDIIDVENAIGGDPLPHIEMWIEKQSGNCKIIEPWRKFKLERLQQNKLGVTLLQKSLKLVQVGDTIVLQAINVFGEIITKHVVLNVLSNVLSNVSLLNKQVFVKEQPEIQQEETAPDSPKISGEKRDEEKKKKKIPSALFIPKASFKEFFYLYNFCF
uniref:Uncharacterized protein n=1 Tax=Meloidogyne incognita TaxID=6306 RepID=A0A914N706_MELIC